MAQTIKSIEHDGLRMHVFVSKPVIFEVASVVLEGEREVALIDAQFSADNARRVVELIRRTGKPLSTIFISYSDPDYYFGLDIIAGEFPDAKILATPQTVWLIEATKDEKMAVWAPQLGENAPKRIVVPTPFKGDHFMFDGRRVEIKRNAGDEQHPWLWIPSARALLGGVYLLDGQHLWVADSQTAEDRAKWRAGLDAMEKLDPLYVIPAHFVPAESELRSIGAITFTRQYLVALEKALDQLTTGSGVVARMKSLYPGLGGAHNLEMSAAVLKGETAWKTVSAFPAICRKVEVNFGGEYLFELDFHDGRTMTFRGLVQREKGLVTDTVQYTAVEIAPKVYMVYWTETDKTHVVHVEDFGRGVVYTNIASPNGTFTNLRGTLRLLP